MISLTSVAPNLYPTRTSYAGIPEETEAEIPGTSNTAISTPANSEISEKAEAQISVVPNTDIPRSSYGWISEKGES